MATVYRAVDSRTGDTVALKVLPPHLAHDQRYLQRFEREGHSVARLQHANIVRVFEAGSADGYHFLSMQFVDGQTLADLLRDRRSLLPARNGGDPAPDTRAAANGTRRRGRALCRKHGPDASVPA